MLRHNPPENLPIKILLIDDDEDDYLITRGLIMEIQDSRHVLDWEADYESGLQRVKAHEHDVYLVDYRLGSHNGLELVQEALQTGCKKPMILLTGVNDREIDIEAMQAGASDYLIKGEITAPLLERSIRYSIQHKKNLQALQESEKRKEMFVVTLTHDLKTPIRAEMRILELFRANKFGPVTDTQSEMLEEVLKSNRYMYRMVDNLLTTYRYEDVQVELNLEKTNINAFIKEVIRGDIISLANEKEHDIVFELDENLPYLSIDQIEMRRVITNLVQNAITYTPPCGVIKIITSQSGESVTVAVKDNGVGIEPEKIDILFQPYSSMAKRFRHIGTGLGLYLSKQIVEAHGGMIGVNTDAGKGSEFYFMLPLQVSAAKNAAC